MANEWSASRVGCHAACPLKFKLHYIEHWAPDQPITNDKMARKGSVFHEAVETYKTGMTRESVWNNILEKAKLHNIDVSEFPYEKGVDRFVEFWEEFIAPAESQGYAVKQEEWIYGEINKEKFKGAIDLMIEGKDDITIFDYKTKSYCDVSDYKNQLILYAYMMGQKRGWDFDTIAQKIKLKIFFPLAIDKKGKTPIELPTYESMLKNLIEIKFTAKDVKDVINNFYCLQIGMIHRTDWTKTIEGNITHGCNYCQYLSAPADPETGFPGCPTTIAQEIPQPVEGVKYHKENWDKK